MIQIRPKIKSWEKNEKKRKKRHEAEEADKTANKLDWIEQLKADPKVLSITNKQPSNALTNNHVWLYHELDQGSDRGLPQRTKNDWENLVPIFGKDVTDFFRDSAIDFWRQHTPKLPSEKENPNSTDFNTLFGMKGITYEASVKRDWFANLNADEAALAFTYAYEELNGFPDWFRDLFNHHSRTIGPIYLREIIYDLVNGSADNAAHNFAYYGHCAFSEITPGLIQWLRSNEPEQEHTLTYLLRAIQHDDTNFDAVKELADLKLSNSETNHELIWLAAWLRLSPEAAMTRISEKTNGLKTDDERSSFAIKLLNYLSGRNSREDIGLKVEIGASMALNLYRYFSELIRHEDDVERKSGVTYTPTAREEAERTRDQLLRHLSQIPGRETYDALKELENETSRPGLKSWMAEMAEKRAIDDAPQTQWTADKFCLFEEQLVLPPSTDIELHGLVIRHLETIKIDLENGDFSDAKLLKKEGVVETEIRNYFANNLRSAATGMFAVSPEVELADSTRTDIRIEGTTVSSVVPIELKRSDEWTLSIMEERLENQLVGQYMRDDQSKYGIFLIVSQGRRSQS